MKNSRTLEPVQSNSVRAGKKSNILSPAQNRNLPTREMHKESKVLDPFDGGAIGWMVR